MYVCIINSDLPFGLEGSHPQCYKKETSTKVKRVAGGHGNKLKTILNKHLQ